MTVDTIEIRNKISKIINTKTLASFALLQIQSDKTKQTDVISLKKETNKKSKSDYLIINKKLIV